MQEEPLPDLLRSLIATEDAITVNQLINIGPNIVDARYIAASPKSLTFYGYDDAQAFSQTWRSLTESYDHLIASMKVSAARLEDPSIPLRYITKLCQPNATEFPVIKETRQIYYNGILYWITSLRPAYLEPNVPDVRHLASQLPSLSKGRPFGGYCIAEINKLLQSLDSDEENILISDFNQRNMNTDISILEGSPAGLTAPVDERVVKAARTDEEGKLQCLRCGHRWKPSVPYPKLCSSCNQPWDKPRVRNQYRRRKGKKAP